MARGSPVSYLIGTTPRTGSWLLCDALQQTGVAGRPGEYGPEKEHGIWGNLHGFPSHRDYFAALPETYGTPNGVVGLKLMFFQLVMFGREAREYLEAESSALDLLRQVVGTRRIVRLERRDRLRQAISWVRARQTKIWSTARPPSIPGGPPEYDADAIREAMRSIEAQSESWHAAARLAGMPVLELHYEDLVADYRAVVASTLDFIGLESGLADACRPGLERQADALTEVWVARASVDLGVVDDGLYSYSS
jgi:LPS sulfotransferase NodH